MLKKFKLVVLNPILLVRFLSKKCLFFVQLVYLEVLYFCLGQNAVSNYIRKVSNPIALLRYLGATIGNDTTIWPGIIINCDNRSMYKHLKVGKHAYILWDVIIDLNDDVIIGDYAHIGTRSTLITHFNLGESPLGIEEYPYVKGKVVIGNGSVVSWGSTVLHGSTIGEHSIISANSLVNGEIPSYSVSVGNPARPIKKIAPKNLDIFKED